MPADPKSSGFERFTRLHKKHFGARPGGRILDYGAGKGDFVVAANEAGLTGYGLEVSSVRQQQFQSSWSATHPELATRYKIYDGRIAPFESRYFDTVYSWFVLEHVPDIHTSVKEIVRVTAEGGAIMLFFQDVRDCYDGHMDVPWPPMLPKEFFDDYLDAFNATPTEKIFMRDTVFYTPTTTVASLLEAVGCEILYVSKPAGPRMNAGLDITSSAEAFEYGKEVRAAVEAGEWMRAPENGIVIARRLASPKGLLPANATRAPARSFNGPSVLDQAAATASLGDLGVSAPDDAAASSAHPAGPDSGGDSDNGGGGGDQSVTEYYDARAGEKLADFVKANPRIEAGLACIDAWAPPNPKRVLEVGCGVGATTWRLARAWPDAQVTGIDISADSIRMAATRFKLPNLNYQVAEVVDPGGFDGPYDLVVLMDVYEHIPPGDRSEFHANLRRSLAPEARIVMTVPTPEMLRRTETETEVGLQPVDEDIGLEEVARFASDVEADLIYSRKIGVWFYGDYNHFVFARYERLADVALRRETPDVGGEAELKRRLGFVGERGLADYLGQDMSPPAFEGSRFSVSDAERRSIAGTPAATDAKDGS